MGNGVTAKGTEIKRITRYANTFKNPEETEKCLDTYNQPKLNHEDQKNLNRSITKTEIESVINSVPTKKSQEPDHFTAALYKNFKEE